MRTKVLIGALLLAVMATMVVAMSASAAPNTRSPMNGKALPLKGKPANLKFVGTTQIKASATKPVAKNSAASKKIQALEKKVNRSLPGKVGSANAPAKGAPDSSGGTPTVPPTQIGATPTSLVKSIKGMNAWDNAQANAFDLTPPDQGMCVGNGYVIEPVNVVLAVYNTGFTKLTGDMALNEFFGLSPDWFTSDPRCYYDPGAKRWFMTMLSFGPDPYAPTDFFVNIAVSQTSNPLLGWYLYELETTDDCPSGNCLADQPLLGANRDGIFISANMFDFYGPEFYGSNVYVLSKAGLATGALPFLIPADLYAFCELETCSGFDPYVLSGIQPAFSPTTGQWDNRMGGIEYLMSSYDFFGDGDDLIALMAFTNTSSLSGPVDLGFFGDDVHTEDYIFPYQYAVQKYDGLIPSGMFYYGADAAGPIQTNDDRMNQVVYSNHTLWSGVNTAVWQKFLVAGKNTYELHAGIAWWGVRPQWNTFGELIGTVVKQGYVAPAHEDAVFPSIGVAANGRGAMAFTMTGMDYYPTAAWVRVNATDGASRVFIAAQGKGTNDDFCEYAFDYCGPGVYPRFGDYSAAVGYGNNVFLATEYIQSPNCNESTWLGDFTCGGTRSEYANWGTALYNILP